MSTGTHAKLLFYVLRKYICSGKTTLAKVLSTTASTAAFDKNPQSKERGITLDLGFSSFQIDSPQHVGDKYKSVQYKQDVTKQLPFKRRLLLY